MSMNRPKDAGVSRKDELSFRIRDYFRSRKRAGFVRLITSGDDRGILEWSAGGKRQRADVELRREERSEGGVDLNLWPWPEGLRPLVVHVGVPGLCRIKPLSGRINGHAVERPARWGQSRYVDDDAAMDLSADDGEEDDEYPHNAVAPAVRRDDDEADEAFANGEIEFDRKARMLKVYAQPADDNADPGWVRVELKWKNSDGDEQIDRFTVELSDCEDDGYWIGSLKIDQPTQTLDGRIEVTVRSLTSDDLVDLRSEEEDDETSEVDGVIARSRFQLHPIDVDQKTNRCVIGGVSKKRLKAGAADQILIRTEVVSGDEKRREGVVGDEERVPFEGAAGFDLESLLRRFRDALHGEGVMTEGGKNLLFELLYQHFRNSFVSWPHDRVEDAIQECLLKLDEILPSRREGERLVGYLHRTITNLLNQRYGEEKRRSEAERTNVSEVVEDAEPLDSDFDDRLIEKLTPEEFGYVALSAWLKYSDVEIQEWMRLSESEVRTLDGRVERKKYILRGLDWIDRNGVSSKDRSRFTPRERAVVERYEFDGMSAEDATREVGVVGKGAAAFRRKAIMKVELAAAAYMLPVAEGDHPKVWEWLGHETVVGGQDLGDVKLGRRLHGQILVATLSRKKLTLACREWIALRVIKRKPLKTAWRKIGEYQDWGGIAENAEVQTTLLNKVVSVWNDHISAIPESIRTIDVDGLRLQ
jgi:DNA-directed RNA polymerase specialized sigma24 family protein